MNHDAQIYIQNEEDFIDGRVVDTTTPITVNIAHSEHLDEAGDVSHVYEIDCFRGYAMQGAITLDREEDIVRLRDALDGYIRRNRIGDVISRLPVQAINPTD